MIAPITFITQPDEKVNDIKTVFGSDFRYQILHNTLHDYQGPEAYVLAEKCKEAVANNISCPVVTDITSVCFNALGGLPGILIESFSNKLTSKELFKLIDAWEDKSAYVLYSLGLLEDVNSEVQIFQGCLSGVMVEPQNPNTFGWEACFQPDGHSKTYDELPKNLQMDISGRKKALRSLKMYLTSKEFSC